MISDLASAFTIRIWRAFAQVLAIVGMILRPALSFAGGLALLGATIALVADVTRWQIGAGKATFESLSHLMRTMAPTSVETLAAAIGRTLHPWLWDPVLLTVLNRPAWLVFAITGVILLYAARERRRINIFVN